MVNDVIFNDFLPTMFEGLELPIIVVYNNTTLDYNGVFVARVWNGMTNERLQKVVIDKSLDNLLSKVPFRFVRISRSQDDPPEIITTFI